VRPLGGGRPGDAVLVQQVNGVSTQGRSESSTAARMSSDLLLTPVCLPFWPNANPSLVAMTTSSGTGCGTSATRSSSWKGP